MDTGTLIVELVKAGAWPAASLTLALLFRRPLVNLVEGLKLTKLKRGDVWLCNLATPPEAPNWKDWSQMPFLNPKPGWSRLAVRPGPLANPLDSNT
jgi:hypothetical protein